MLLIWESPRESATQRVGIILFGESYLSAFWYLVAPQIGGGRTKDYPDTQERAETLERYARNKLQIDVSDYSKLFMPDTPFRFPHDRFICSMADKVLASLNDALFSKAQELAAVARVQMPEKHTSETVLESFKNGAPYDDAATLGDLINAAWKRYRDAEQQQKLGAKHSVVDYISDLVLKSA